MPPAKTTFQPPPDAPNSVLREDGIESGFIGTLQGLKYEPSGARQTGRKASPKGERGGSNQYRPDITDRATLEQNFREKFESLNRVRLTDSEFARLLDEIVTPDVFTAARTLRQINAFTRCPPFKVQSNEKRRTIIEPQGTIDRQRKDLTGKIEGKLLLLVSSQILFTVYRKPL